MVLETLNPDAQKESLTDGDAKLPLHVCFVCTGNTCRSPMAAAVTNALARGEWQGCSSAIAEAMTPRIVAISRGLYAEEGAPISKNAVLALMEADVAAYPDADYRTHTAKTVGEEDVRSSDWLVAVSGRHATELLMRFPFAASKIVCMPDAIGDPWGGDLASYRACLAEITDGVKKLFFAKGESI